MVQLTALWLPILLATVIVFIASSIIHMVLAYHRTDLKKVPREDEVMDALRKFDIPPGDYQFPCAGGPGSMRSPEFQDKWKKGPVGILTVIRNENLSMGKSLILWFIFCLVVSIFAAYISGRALPPKATYLDVFRFAGSTAFAGYSLALAQSSIWFGKSWSSTIKSMFDGLIYALLTAGTLGWLWPR